MIISHKQQEANRRNAQRSTGPKTPEGKAAVRLNAVTYGLRARSTLIDGEDPEEYKQLWANLEAEWQPQTCTERMLLEQMSTAHWLLARIARGESRIYEAGIRLQEQFVLLREVSTQRARLERSFTSALRELKQSQKERQARRPQPIETKPTAKIAPVPAHPPAKPPAPYPDYVMSLGTEAHPVFCPPITPDSR